MGISLTVIIPTLNEGESIGPTIDQIPRDLPWLDVKVLVIDGNSTDGTVEEAERLGFKSIRQKGDGLGDAYREAVRNASCENILFFSPDGNAPPEYIPKLIKKMNEGNYDIVQISRFGKNGKSEDDTAITAFGNRMFTFLVNVFFGG